MSIFSSRAIFSLSQAVAHGTCPSEWLEFATLQAIQVVTIAFILSLNYYDSLPT